MTTLPFQLRSDITRATFHALDGDPSLVPEITGRIEAGLAALDPADAGALAPEIGRAIHQVVMLPPSQNPVRRLLLARRYAQRERHRQAIRQRRIDLPGEEPRLAWVLLFDPDPEVRAAARTALPEPPSPFHAALARTVAE